jgi:hypothetical protein
MQKISIVSASRAVKNPSPPQDRLTTKAITIAFVVGVVLLWIAMSALMIFETRLT